MLVCGFSNSIIGSILLFFNIWNLWHCFTLWSQLNWSLNLSNFWDCEFAWDAVEVYEWVWPWLPHFFNLFCEITLVWDTNWQLYFVSALRLPLLMLGFVCCLLLLFWILIECLSFWMDLVLIACVFFKYIKKRKKKPKCCRSWVGFYLDFLELSVHVKILKYLNGGLVLLIAQLHCVLEWWISFLLLLFGIHSECWILWMGMIAIDPFCNFGLKVLRFLVGLWNWKQFFFQLEFGFVELVCDTNWKFEFCLLLGCWTSSKTRIKKGRQFCIWYSSTWTLIWRSTFEVSGRLEGYLLLMRSR